MTVYVQAAPAPSPSASQGKDAVEDLAVTGSLADDPPSQSVDLNTLTRNTYILIGLGAAAVVLLLVVLVMMVVNSSKHGYTPVREVYSIPPAVDKPYSSEAAYSDKYPNPYSDQGH